MNYTYKICFIGCGNMGSAMLKGILSAGLAKPEEIIASVHTEKSRARLKETFGIQAVTDNKEAAKNAAMIILAVKPDVCDKAAKEIREVLLPDQIIISIAAGRTLAQLRDLLISIRDVGKLQLVRAMPNTPAMAGEAMTAASASEDLTDESREKVLSLLNCFGKTEFIPESLMDTVTGLSGSSPAFIYILIEAMGDAGVKGGMPRKMAYEFAAQTVLGSAKMVLTSGKHPAALKDDVCSPAGTTIAGVAALEEKGFRAAVIDAVTAAIEKAKGI